MIAPLKGRWTESARVRGQIRGAHMQMKVITGLAAMALAFGAAHAAQAQDAKAGERVFAKCRPCHQVGPDAINGVGPVLNGVIGRKAGTYEDYNYSSANKKSGIVWDEKSFKEYIHNPRAKIPGTKMAFAGITKEKDIDDLFAYLNQFDASGEKK
jgi:cytochrome c